MDGDHFQLSTTFDLAGQLLREGFIFVDERGDITLAEVKARIKEKVWFVGGSANLKRVFLEDVKLDIENPYNLASAKIISGGIYLQQTMDARTALKERKLLRFIKQNADSPVALIEVGNLMRFGNMPGFFKEFDFSSPEELYSALSSRLQQSEEGKAIKKKLDEPLKN
ncbi:hypothetical protein D3C73_1188450 [compost metagenome]